MKLTLGSAIGLTLLASVPLANSAQPPAGDGYKSLLEVVRKLEKTYSPIVEASFDDGAWEVEAFKGDTAYELTVDPRSGKVLSEFRDFGEAKPPAGSMALSEIIRSLAEADYTDIDEISFERRNWEVEALRDGQKRELHVDPQTGAIASDRVDD
jgi:uncharacterized membrane protein YkoI